MRRLLLYIILILIVLLRFYFGLITDFTVGNYNKGRSNETGLI